MIGGSIVDGSIVGGPVGGSMIGETYGTAASLLGVTMVTAVVVNLLAPSKRPRLRRLVVIAALYCVAFALGHWVVEPGSVWAQRVAFGADLLAAFGFVSAGGVLIFDAILSRFRLALPPITIDVFVGIAYVIATVRRRLRPAP
jgi:hypothetical protein